ncbi:MAG: EF-hand domain-containing protein [Candidatus Andeanibacterium colombiense]|uniref:EF-hand domain-containing protein n=1 Tax=Candidatus Andeanibacterium colombiense TaxID=3121345 RepID=A0AAJ5X473_9SPHN|nr:MAG: EF-hand domain-containing protein [Sphingomonadaceae bacterium]
MRPVALYLGIALLAGSAAAQGQGIEYGADASRIGGPVNPETGITPPRKDGTARAVSRKGIDDTVERMFKAADSNRDGTVTLAEFNSEVDARKNKIIAERFARIDTDHNQSLSMAEFAAWQRSIGAVALSDRLDTPQTEMIAESLPVEYGRKDDVDFMSAVLEPLNATMIVSANTDYDAGTSLAELLEYEHGRFDKADLNHDGFVTWDEIDKLRKGK